jgi:hypothetical protein
MLTKPRAAGQATGAARGRAAANAIDALARGRSWPRRGTASPTDTGGNVNRMSDLAAALAAARGLLRFSRSGSLPGERPCGLPSREPPPGRSVAPLSAPSAPAEDGYRHGRLRFVEPASACSVRPEVSAEEALANQPFLPGDRVWTDAYGRAEFPVPRRNSRAPRRPQQAGLLGPRGGPRRAHRARLWSGSLMVRLRTRDAGAVRDRDPGRDGPGAPTRPWSASTSTAARPG